MKYPTLQRLTEDARLQLEHFPEPVKAWIKEHAPIGWKTYQEHGWSLYRGMTNRRVKGMAGIVEPHPTRRTISRTYRDSMIVRNKLFDMAFPELPSRFTSTFVSTAPEGSAEFGTLHHIFPPDDAKCAVLNSEDMNKGMMHGFNDLVFDDWKHAAYAMMDTVDAWLTKHHPDVDREHVMTSMADVIRFTEDFFDSENNIGLIDKADAATIERFRAIKEKFVKPDQFNEFVNLTQQYLFGGSNSHLERFLDGVEGKPVARYSEAVINELREFDLAKVMPAHQVYTKVHAHPARESHGSREVWFEGPFVAIVSNLKVKGSFEVEFWDE